MNNVGSHGLIGSVFFLFDRFLDLNIHQDSQLLFFTFCTFFMAMFDSYRRGSRHLTVCFNPTFGRFIPTTPGYWPVFYSKILSTLMHQHFFPFISLHNFKIHIRIDTFLFGSWRNNLNQVVHTVKPAYRVRQGCVQPDWGYFEWTEQIISINPYKLIQTFFVMILKNVYFFSK